MNRIIFLINIILIPFLSIGQITLIPDSNFETALINLGYDSILDGEINTYSINNIDTLNVMYKNIDDLTGIEDFTNLTVLKCDQNNLTNLDVSSNNNLIKLTCTYNQLTNLILNNNMTSLECYYNNLTTLDFSSCHYLEVVKCSFNNLITLDVSNNIYLRLLGCSFNHLTTLDVSNNPYLYLLSCSNNLLTTLNVKNGNNHNFGVGFPCGLGFYTINNPELICITVDNPNWATQNWLVDSNQIDTHHYFMTDCSGITNITENKLTKKLVKIIDMLGKETELIYNVPLIHIYEDGTTEKKISVK